MDLSSLTNASRPKKKVQRVGRGPGSKRGKTSCRGHKGDKSRSGYKRRYGKEGGQLPFFQRLPNRGFTNARFKKNVFELTLERIETSFEDGEIVNRESLINKGYSLRRVDLVKVLGTGEINKKVVIEANQITKGAMKKLEEKSIEFKLV